MEILIQVTGGMIIEKVKENSFGKMEILMKGLGAKIENKNRRNENKSQSTHNKEEFKHGSQYQ